MRKLFEVTVPTINEHLTALYFQKEIAEEATIRNFRIVQNGVGKGPKWSLPSDFVGDDFVSCTRAVIELS